jgi:hypothetical protein
MIVVQRFSIWRGLSLRTVERHHELLAMLWIAASLRQLTVAAVKLSIADRGPCRLTSELAGVTLR